MSKTEMSLDVDARQGGRRPHDRGEHQQSAADLSAAIGSELDLAAWKIEKIVKQRFDPKHSPMRRKD